MAFFSLIPSPLVADTSAETKDHMGLFSDEMEETLDASFEQLNETLQDTVNYFDTFFVDDRFSHEYRGNRLRIRFETKREERDGFEFDSRFRLNVKLPRTRNRWNLVIELSWSLQYEQARCRGVC